MPIDSFEALERWQNQTINDIRSEADFWQVYHRNQRYNRLDALLQAVPSLQKVFDEATLKAMLLAYIDTTVAQEPNLMLQGNDLPDWLNKQEAFAEAPWVADLVRWDLCMQHAWLSSSLLAHQGGIRLDVALLRTVWNWPEWLEGTDLQALDAPRCFVFFRRDREVQLERVSEAWWDTLVHLTRQKGDRTVQVLPHTPLYVWLMERQLIDA